MLFTLAVFVSQQVAASDYEYLAFVPNGGGPGATSDPSVSWVKLEYPETGPTSASDVTVTPVTSANSELGSWYNMGMGSDVKGAMLTAKIRGANMYALVNTGSAPNSAGCCADSLRIYPKGSGKVTDINLETVMQQAFPGNTFAHVTHTFDLVMLGGELHALAMVQYAESQLSGVKTDSLVAVKLSDGSLRKTALGEDHFSIYQHLGTTSELEDDTRFQLQYYTGSGGGSGGAGEEWHGNGVNRFKALDGTWIVAITQRFANGALLIKDPFFYSAADGGGKILQRFGTPGKYVSGVTKGYHYFGIDQSEGYITTGVHNLWHNVYGDRETLTMFVNGMSSDSYSHAFEFDVKLVNEEDAEKSDSAFATSYDHWKFSFKAQAQGGARSLGNGVVIGACGAAMTGYEIADVSGGHQTISHTGSLLYDPFVRVTGKALMLV